MISKTPQFDKALDKVLHELIPHARECDQRDISEYCEKKFEITDQDIEFLKILRVPPPIQCPTCRRQRRFSFMNWTRLFKRPCNAPGHNEEIISSVSTSCPFPVVDIPYYQSSYFDPTRMGFVSDIGKSFWSQFYELRRRVPLPAMVQEPSNVNAEYSMGGRNSKNVYYATGVFNSEDILYANGIRDCRECMDIIFVTKADRVYEAIRSENIVNSSYIYFSEECIDSMFLFDCRNCINCFGCVNLRNKSFCFFNEQLSREAYLEKIKAFDMGDRKTLRSLLDRFWSFVKSRPIRASQNFSSERVNGVSISQSRDLDYVIAAENSGHVRHSEDILGHHDSMDVTVSGGHSHHLYETSNVGSQSSVTKFSFTSKYITDSEFLLNCKRCKNCFGCVGLEDKSFYILNIPYKPDEYWSTVDKIKLAMLGRGEYGMGVPISFSPYAYNITLANVPFPLASEAVTRLHGYSQGETESNVKNMPTLKSDEVPRSIDDVSDTIIQTAVLSEHSGRPFRIVPKELEFYRRHRLSIPLSHPYERMDARTRIMGSYKAYRAVCSHCGKNIQSAFDPAEGFTLYCDMCYQNEVL
ncbi:hypothetical protein HY967_04590 [Candidatus Jorgensenbacteria bacterium]|nr:hypothetical protein [Candidatus Jorgensenbacteria bacterium]